MYEGIISKIENGIVYGEFFNSPELKTFDLPLYEFERFDMIPLIGMEVLFLSTEYPNKLNIVIDFGRSGLLFSATPTENGDYQLIDVKKIQKRKH